MRRELILTREPIDEHRLASCRNVGPETGAVVTFLGIVRGTEAGKTIRALDYESFESMAAHQFELLFGEMEKRWPIEFVRVVHRLGDVPVSQPSLYVEVISSHRQEAFAACAWLIDETKKVVPIWKRPLT